MKTSPSFRLNLLRATGVVGAVSLFAAMAGAAPAPTTPAPATPMPVISLRIEQKQTKTVKAAPGRGTPGSSTSRGGRSSSTGSSPDMQVFGAQTSTSFGGSYGGSSGSSGSTSKSGNTSTMNNIYLTVTVSNSAPVDAPGVVVDYILYNRTSVTSKGEHSTTIDTITGSETVEVPKSGKVDFDTKDVPNKDTEVKAAAGKGQLGSGKVTSKSTQTFEGYYMTAKFDGKVVYTSEKPSGVKKKMEAEIKAQR